MYTNIKEYLEKNYPAREEDREIDEYEQKIDEYEDLLNQSPFKNYDCNTMFVMTSLPATQRVLVTINEMSKIIGIGHNSIRRLVRENPNAEYIHWVGTRAYIKRDMFINVILSQSTL